MMRQRSSVLVGVLWVLALLALVVIGVLHSASLDLRVVKNYEDQIQAHYLALAGIEKAKALLYQDAITRKRSAKNHSGDLYDAPQAFRDVPLGRGLFRVIHQAERGEGKGLIYGVTDEEGRLNVNQVSGEVLANLCRLLKLPPAIASSILDWRDQDNSVTSGGGEAEYYTSLAPPYIPRNGPLETPRELLMVRGVSSELFLGEDVNDNGLLDPEEDDGNDSYPPDNRDGILDAGWCRLISVNSSIKNVNAAGQERVNVQSADEASLTSVRGISSDIAKAIVAYRGQNRLESLADLLDVTAASAQNQAPPPPNPAAPGAAAAGQPAPGTAPNPRPPQPAGPKVISEDLLLEIADDVTTADGPDLAGPINVNTAGKEVLACLPGVDEQLAQAIISYRQSAGFLPNVAWLLKVPGMSRQIFKQVAPLVSARSETYRILSEGKVTSTGARKRIQVVVRIGASDIETLSYREDL